MGGAVVGGAVVSGGGSIGASTNIAAPCSAHTAFCDVVIAPTG